MLNVPKSLQSELFGSENAQKALLQEFQRYRTRRYINNVSMGVLHAGFRNCWANKDYATIVAVGKKVTEDFLLQDDKLISYYDMATTRLLH